MKMSFLERLNDAWYAIKNATKMAAFYIRKPYNQLRMQHPCSRFNTWHEHICLPLRLGREMYNNACPFAYKKDFLSEYEDECDECPYFTILELVDGVPKLIGDARFIKAGWGQDKEEMREQYE